MPLSKESREKAVAELNAQELDRKGVIRFLRDVCHEVPPDVAEKLLADKPDPTQPPPDKKAADYGPFKYPVEPPNVKKV